MPCCSLDSRQKRLARLLQCLTGVMQWSTLIVALLGPFLWPKGTLFLFLPLMALAAGHAMRAVFFGTRTLYRLRTYQPEDAIALYERARHSGVAMPWEDVLHAVIIPNYKESLELLRETLDAVAEQSEAARTIVVLAMEARELGAEDKAHQLAEHYSGRFADMFHTLHPAGLPGEVVGKASNESWAARRLHDRLVALGIDVRRVVVTIADADAVLHSNYLMYLNAHFAANPNRHRRFWQAHVTYFRNIFAVPPPSRVVDMMLSTDHLSWLSTTDVLLPLSTYSVSLALLHEIDYWDGDVIDEDFHIFTKASFFCREPVVAQPLYVPIQMTACQADTWHETLVQRFQQAMRHAMGARIVGYILALQMRGPPFHGWLFVRVLMVHVLLPMTLMVTSVGLPWWRLWNGAVVAAARSGDPVLAWALTLLNVFTVVTSLCFLSMLGTYLAMKRHYLQQWPSAADFVAFLCLPLSAPVYMYIPILFSQTLLFFQNDLHYSVAPKPSSTAPPTPAPSMTLPFSKSATTMLPNGAALFLAAAPSLLPEAINAEMRLPETVPLLV